MDPVFKAITAAVIKIMIWIIPVFLLVKIVEKRNPSTYLGLNHNRGKGLKWAGWISLALATYFIIVNLLILKNEINLKLGFDEWLNTIILVGITEEIVFRGFILKKCMKVFKFWKANGITSILFVSIHFPIWFYKNLFEFPSIIGSIVIVFIISVFFGLIYKKTNSLWSVIVIHSMYNLFISVFN